MPRTARWGPGRRGGAAARGRRRRRHSATLGGEQLAVSRYSRHPDAAASLVAHLTSAAEQKRRAIIGGFNPTIRALYRDPEVLAANPFFGELYDTFVNAVARPGGGDRQPLQPGLGGVLERRAHRALGPARAGGGARNGWTASCCGSGAAAGGSRAGGALALARAAPAGGLGVPAPMLVVLALVAGWPLARTIWFSLHRCAAG